MVSGGQKQKLIEQERKTNTQTHKNEKYISRQNDKHNKLQELRLSQRKREKVRQERKIKADK